MNAIEWMQHVIKCNYEREFLIDTLSGAVLTFGDIYESACAIAHDLRTRSVKKGDKVAILLHNSSAVAKLYFACLFSGVVTVPVNPALRFSEMLPIVVASRATLLVVSPETVSQVDREALAAAHIGLLIVEDARARSSAVGNEPNWDIASLEATKTFRAFEGVCPEDTMTIVFTSGTTAVPKGVVHRISDVVDNARFFNDRVGIGPENRFYGILAMTYLGGYYNLLLLPFVAGASVVLVNAFDAHSSLSFWKPAMRNGVNTLWLVPTIMAILLEMDRTRDGEVFCREHVRLALVGTAPLPLELRRRFEERYGVALYENYGLSETLFISTNAPTVPVLNNCTGRLLPGIQATVVNDQGKGLSYGEEGEIWVSSPYVMEGYVDSNVGEVTSVSTNTWFATGDIGHLSANADLFITGRKKDLIIRGGINISPADIENALYTLSDIHECAVVGIPHPMYGEDIAVVVRLEKASDFSAVEKELRAVCRRTLAEFKQPSQILEMEEMPHTSTGKINKKKLRDFVVHKLGLEHMVVNRKEKGGVSTPTKSAMVPGRVRRTISRPPVQYLEALKKVPVSILSDCLNRMGIMDANVHSLVRGRSFVGPAFTVEEVEGGNLMSHVAIDLIQPGDVLVIDAKGVTTRSTWGGLQSLMVEKRRVAAVVVYGCVRDYDQIVSLDLPVFALGTSPGGPLKGWTGNINYPISCAGVVVNPGDVVAGDNDGIVVIPRHLVADVLEKSRQKLAQEEEWSELVHAGKSILEVMGLSEKIDEFGLLYE